MRSRDKQVGTCTLGTPEKPCCHRPIPLHAKPYVSKVLLIKCGFVLVFTSPLVAVRLALVAVAFHLLLIHNEERWLAKQFGDEWIKYKESVSRWLPWTRPTLSKRP